MLHDLIKKIVPLEEELLELKGQSLKNNKYLSFKIFHQKNEQPNILQIKYRWLQRRFQQRVGRRV